MTMLHINLDQPGCLRKYASEILSTQQPELCFSSKTIPYVRRREKSLLKAFTIIELLCVITMITLILGTVAPVLFSQLNKARVKRARYEIRLIAGEIEEYVINHEELPDELSDIGYGHRTDPWGNEYQYLRINGGDKNITSKVAKVYGEKPLNTDFDLYSMGRDGLSASPLTAGPVRDDILRLDNGGYLGTGADYLAKAKK